MTQPDTDTNSAGGFRPLPRSLEDVGLPPIFLANLLLKHAFYMDFFTLGELGESLKLSASVVSFLLDYLKKEKYIEDRGPDPLKPGISSLSLANRLALTGTGKSRAATLLEYDAYVGPAPVSLEEYTLQTRRQRIQLGAVTPERLPQAFRGLVLSPKLLDQLGPASISGKPLFLYGAPGNGKTTIATRLGELWDDTILIPYAIFMYGNVVRVFDDNLHHVVTGASAGLIQEDQRWVHCRRPAVIAGGELSIAMLDLTYNPLLKYYEAPLQLKANNGMFLVDDFGRQQMSPQELLNRWIIPLENKTDYLCLHTGQKVAIPFEIFLVFATNLEPQNLVDDAFLRRIRSKVKVLQPSRDDFIEIFKDVCCDHQVEFNPEAVEHLLTHYYDGDQRRMDACHPRDLLEQIIDYSLYHQIPIRLTPESIDQACSNYFVY
jgi:hypothetical protein